MKIKERTIKLGQKAYGLMPMKVKGVDKENHILTMVASTQDEDRHGDVIVQSGWDLKPYSKNPVILNSHNYNDATEVIAKAISTKIEGKGKRSKLIQEWQFAVEENPKAKIIFDLYAGGYLHASSVGFIPRKFKEDKNGNRDWFTIEEAELLEVSAVSVPANAMATAKSAGIDVDKLNIKENENDDEKEPELERDTENNEDQEADGQEPTDNSDDSKDTEKDGEPTGEPSEADTENKPDGGDKEPKQAKTKLSKNKRIIKAIKTYENREKRNLRKVKELIEQLINQDPAHRAMTKETQKKLKKRKINKAIRALVKIK